MDTSTLSKVSFGVITMAMTAMKDPRVQRLVAQAFVNWAKRTPNEIDDMVVEILIRSFAEGQTPTEDYVARVEKSLNDNVLKKFDDLKAEGRRKRRSRIFDAFKDTAPVEVSLDTEIETDEEPPEDGGLSEGEEEGKNEE